MEGWNLPRKTVLDPCSGPWGAALKIRIMSAGVGVVLSLGLVLWLLPAWAPLQVPRNSNSIPQPQRVSCPATPRQPQQTMSQTFGQLPEELQLATSAHVKYIQSLDTRKDEYDYWLTEHLRLNGLYWGLTALHLLGRPDALPRAETIDFVLSCQHDSGGFGAAPGHDAHLLSTVSAVQILATVDAFDDLEARGRGKARVGECASFGPTQPGPASFERDGGRGLGRLAPLPPPPPDIGHGLC